MKRTQKNSMIAIVAVAVVISLAIFAGDTVSLIVTRKNSQVDGKWDPVSGQEPNKRYIKVSAGTDVKLKGDGKIVTNKGRKGSLR